MIALPLHVSLADILRSLDIKETTFKQALRYLRKIQGLTIYDPRHDGYKLDDKDKGRINIGEELLLTKHQLSLLQEKISLLDKLTNTKFVDDDSMVIAKKLSQVNNSSDSLDSSADMIDIIEQHVRTDNSSNFIELLSAIKSSQSISCYYQSRSSAPSKRIISPQRLIHFKGNWYLLGFCHERSALRIFAIENFTNIDNTEGKKTITNNYKNEYVTIDKKTQEKEYAETYGIFGGEYVEDANIIFDAHIKQWVIDENWHYSEQKEVLANGNLLLTLPIGKNIRGLVNDLMRYADCIQDIKPKRLKKALLKNLETAQKNLGH